MTQDSTDMAAEPGGSTCYKCGEAFVADQHAYRESYGQIVERTDHGVVFGTTGGIVVRHFCQQCWQKHRGREDATYLKNMDPARLWGILKAARGDLVADSKHITIGGRAWVRVVDDGIEARHSTAERTDDGIRFSTEPTPDFDRNDFADLFQPSEHEDRSPTLVMLRSVEDTPFPKEEVGFDVA